MFEVVPPGMQDRIRSPAAMAGGRAKSAASPKPIAGMKPYCETTPMARP